MKLLPSFDCKVRKKLYRLSYYLVDVIYPKWAIFMNTRAMGTTQKEKCFSWMQEGMRNDVERAFGVLLS